MKWRITNRQTRLYLGAATVLVAGLGSAIAIYLTAGNATDSSLVDDFENSKRYHHSLELYGGEMNVLTDQLNRWFESLWHGESLAYTIACITLAISGGIFFVAYL